MTSETSAVLVAVRVRPLNSRESPFECTISVVDEHTVTLTDITNIASSSTSTVGNGSGGGGANNQHVFTFDKVFWSIPPNVLPVPVSETASHGLLARFTQQDSLVTSAISCTTSIGFDGVSKNGSFNSLLHDTPSHPLSRMSTSCLPCFASVPEYDDQESVYAYIGPRMYKSVMVGYNSCLFAYGQTGSGKTHSLLGPPELFAPRSESRGVIPRLCEDLFELMRKERDEDGGISYNVECSFFEIYCERVRDLLGSCNAGKNCDGSSSNGANFANGSMCSQISSVYAHQSLRIRQHPTRGPYVEGLSLIKVRDANAVIRLLSAGLRERVTAETKMNEHSSRSHAVLQLHITRVAVVPEEGNAAGVTTKTRVCKVNMVDLAGSERVTQSGASGDRFEEARNINLSLTTLGRVILQLTEKQSGKHVIPAYRDSVLTWLLSDSLGGNSKTIMLATIAPSAYCYQQTLNTLRFAGLTKKVINVATINEDHRFQKLIASLRQQIVKLTLQLEEGKAAEVFQAEIRALRSDRNELEAQIDSMRLAMSTMVQSSQVAALQKRVAKLEETNGRLMKEKTQLQRKLLSTTTALREELGQKNEQIVTLRESLAQRSAEVQELITRQRAIMEQRNTSPSPPPPSSAAAAAAGLASHKELERQIAELEKRLEVERQRAEEAIGARKNLQQQLETLQQEHCSNVEVLETTQLRLSEKAHALDVTQSDLEATRKMLRLERADNSAAERERELVEQLEQTHEDYLREKQINVDLLLRLSEAEVQASHMSRILSVKARDINELESLLLEETETSERYCIQSLYNSYLFATATAFVREFFSISNVCKSLISNGHAKMGGNWLNNGTESTSAITFEQVLCECIHFESHNRVLLENMCYAGLLELIVQKSALQQLCGAAGTTSSELIALRTTAEETVEESKRLQRKIAFMESTIEKAEKETLEMRSTLRDSEAARNSLVLQVEDMAEQIVSLQSSNDALIQKIAEGQSLREMLCSHSNDASISLTTATTTTARSSPTSPRMAPFSILKDKSLEVKEMEAKVLSQRETHHHHHHHQFEKKKNKQLTKKSKQQNQQQEDGKDEKLRLQKEIVHYQEQLGVLRAQLEKERVEKVEKTRLLQRENEALKQDLQHVREEYKISLNESTNIVKDYEAHIGELQETITTLQSALEEEYNNTDKARDEVQKMVIDKRESLEELRKMTEMRDALQTAFNNSEYHFEHLNNQVKELQMAYNNIEKQLTNINISSADVYLTVDCSGKTDGNNNWLEKAMHEKEMLEKQKEVVRRLNEELLATVRERNESVRDVDRQITKMQRGGISPDMTDLLSTNDESPLGAQLIK